MFTDCTAQLYYLLDIFFTLAFYQICAMQLFWTFGHDYLRNFVFNKGKTNISRYVTVNPSEPKTQKNNMDCIGIVLPRVYWNYGSINVWE